MVAEMRRPTTEITFGAAEQALERLHAEGMLVLGLPQEAQAYHRTKVRLKGAASQSLLDTDRAEQ